MTNIVINKICSCSNLINLFINFFIYTIIINLLLLYHYFEVFEILFTIQMFIITISLLLNKFELKFNEKINSLTIIVLISTLVNITLFILLEPFLIIIVDVLTNMINSFIWLFTITISILFKYQKIVIIKIFRKIWIFYSSDGGNFWKAFLNSKFNNNKNPISRNYFDRLEEEKQQKIFKSAKLRKTTTIEDIGGYDIHQQAETASKKLHKALKNIPDSTEKFKSVKEEVKELDITKPYPVSLIYSSESKTAVLNLKTEPSLTLDQIYYRRKAFDLDRSVEKHNDLLVITEDFIKGARDITVTIAKSVTDVNPITISAIGGGINVGVQAYNNYGVKRKAQTTDFFEKTSQYEEINDTDSFYRYMNTDIENFEIKANRLRKLTQENYSEKLEGVSNIVKKEKDMNITTDNILDFLT